MQIIYNFLFICHLHLRQDVAQLAFDRSGDEVVSSLRWMDTVHAEIGQVVAVVEEWRCDIQHRHTLLVADLINGEAVHVVVVADALLLSAEPREDVAAVMIAHVARNEVIETPVVDQRQGEQNRLAA